jgi:serine protease Do
MRTTGVEGMGYAISISSVKEIINELSLEETRNKYSDDERGYIGITGVNITSDINTMYGYPIGIQVRSVTEGSAAYNAGIVKNDIIFSFDGEEITDFIELSDMMRYYAVGEKVTVEYYRMEDGEYKKHSAELVLTAKPE